jgi:hypothetical protein
MYGFGRYGLHDARLLSMEIGDGLFYKPDGRNPFRLSRQATDVRIHFLNYYQEFLYTFAYRGVKTVECKLRADSRSLERGRPAIGDLYTYELSAFDAEYLQCRFVFATGAEIVVIFRKLRFRRQRIGRRYRYNEMYR